MSKNFSLIVIIISFGCFIANYFLVDELKNLWFTSLPLIDFYGQRALCAYTLRGIDPYAITGLQTPLIEEIGIIPAEWSTTPWGLVLGNLFYSGFLSMPEAIYYFWFLNILFLPWTTLVVARNLKIGLRKFVIFFVTFIAFFANFFISTYFGNASSVICCFLILSCIIADELPIFSGIFLGAAMIKPQIALPICFALLLRKNFKVLTIAALIDFVAWGVAAFMTNQSPITLLTEFFSMNTGGGNVFWGLFTLAFPENKSLAMLTSMLAGFLFIYLTWRRDFKYEKIFWACPACLATTFFAYSSGNDYFILLLPAFACLYLASRAELFHEKIFWIVSFVFLSIGVYALFLPLRIFLENIIISFLLTRTIFAVAIILIGYLMVRNFKSENPTELSKNF